MFAIAIPTINRADLLNEALGVYKTTMRQTQIFVCDNGNQQNLKSDNNIVVYKQSKNLGVAASWNYLLKEVFKGYNYGLVLNDDVIFHKTFDEVVDLITETNTYDFVHGQQDLSAFLLPKKTFYKVGEFDEHFFPAYFEDNDYKYRLKLLGLNTLQTDKLNPRVFRGSQSIALNPNLNLRFEDNKRYYIEKWGGLPGEETFSKPFNELSRSQA